MEFKLREYRKKAGMTQADLASAIGKTLRTVQSWESGSSFPDLEVTFKICTALSVTPNELVGWNEEDSKERTSDQQQRNNPSYFTLKVNTDGSVELMEKDE